MINEQCKLAIVCMRKVNQKKLAIVCAAKRKEKAAKNGRVG